MADAGRVKAMKTTTPQGKQALIKPFWLSTSIVAPSSGASWRQDGRPIAGSLNSSHTVVGFKKDLAGAKKVRRRRTARWDPPERDFQRNTGRPEHTWGKLGHRLVGRLTSGCRGAVGRQGCGAAGGRARISVPRSFARSV